MIAPRTSARWAVLGAAAGALVAACTWLSPLDYLSEGAADADSGAADAPAPTNTTPADADPADVDASSDATADADDGDVAVDADDGGADAADADAGPIVQPPTTLAPHQYYPLNLVQDSLNLYWHHAGTGQVATVPKSGGTVRMLNPQGSSLNSVALAVDPGASGYVYWTITNSVYRAPKAGPPAAEKVYQGPTDCLRIEADDNYLYVLHKFNPANGFDPGSVVRASKTDVNAPSDVVFKGQAVVGGGYDPFALFVDTDILWFDKTDGRARKLARDVDGGATVDGGGAPATLLGTGSDAHQVDPASSFVADAQYLYSANRYGPSVDRVLRLGAVAKETIWTMQGAEPMGVAVDATYAYVTDRSGGALHRIPKSGTGATFDLATNLQEPTTIVADDVALYFIVMGPSQQEGAVLRLAKP